MGLLMSDTVLIDTLLDDASRWLNSLSEWAYPLDATLNTDAEESADSPERARLTPASRPWFKTLAVCLRQ